MNLKFLLPFLFLGSSFTSVRSNLLTQNQQASRTSTPAGTWEHPKYYDGGDVDFFIDIYFNYEALENLTQNWHYDKANWFYNFLTNYDGTDTGNVSWWASNGTAFRNYMQGNSFLDAFQLLINGEIGTHSTHGYPPAKEQHPYDYENFNFSAFQKIVKLTIDFHQRLFLTFHIVSSHSGLYLGYVAIGREPVT